MKVLVVDDDLRLREALEVGLQLQWEDAEVMSAADGESGGVAAEQYRSVQQAEDYLGCRVERLASDRYSAQTAVPFGGSAASWIVEEPETGKQDEGGVQVHVSHACCST